MKRRTILKRIGVASVATAGVASTASAASRPALGLDQTLDVSDVSGTVELQSLVDGDLETELSDEFLASLPDGVEASDVKITVGDDLDVLDLGTKREDQTFCYICCEDFCYCGWCICVNCEDQE